MRNASERDLMTSLFRRQHLTNGYTDPALAMQMADHLLRDLQAQPPQEGMQRMALARGLLRQALLLNPFDTALRGVVASLCAGQRASEVYMRWLDAVRDVLDSGPAVYMGDVLQRTTALEKDDEKLLHGALYGDSPAYRFTCAGILWEIGNGAFFEQAARAFVQTPEGGIAAPFFAWGALSMNRPELCRELLSLAVPGPVSLHVSAELALREGHREQGIALLRDALQAEPALFFLVYRLVETLRGAPPAGFESVARGRSVSVALYTWNKFDVTLDTLRSLVHSDIGNASITLLNNGSDAFSPRQLEDAAREAACGRPVDFIHLPVNVGAPAARNWLWQLPAMRQADYVAYLDDDVLLPEGWLRMYMQSLDEYPQAAVVGPKVVNPGSIASVQYVLRNFYKAGNKLIRFTNNAPLFWDMGQYDYRSPCLSVMGCCHLFNRRLCDRLGVPQFDVRFSPSQVDDIEHDIQVWNAGGRVLYDGRVCVVHRQDTGRKAPLSEAGWGHVWGNHMKMEAKFSGERLKELKQTVEDCGFSHFTAALQTVAPLLSREARGELAAMTGGAG
jgi:GT2 family glycosyltransferase